MSFTRYWVIDENYKTKYDNVIDYEEFDESSDEELDGFEPPPLGTSIDEIHDDRSKVVGWSQTEFFFTFI